VSLLHGINVLYGKNGAGKSQIIDAVSKLASGDVSIASSHSALYFEWARPIVTSDQNQFELYEGNPWPRFERAPVIDDAYNIGLGSDELPVWANTFNRWAMQAILYLCLIDSDETTNQNDLLHYVMRTLLNIEDELEDSTPNTNDGADSADRSLPASPIVENIGFLTEVFGVNPTDQSDYWNGAFRRHLVAMYHAASTGHCWTVPQDDEEEDSDVFTVKQIALLLLEAAVRGRFVVQVRSQKLTLGLVSDITPPSLMSELISEAVSELEDMERPDASMVESFFEPVGEFGAGIFADWYETPYPNWWEGIIWSTEVEASSIAYVLREKARTLEEIVLDSLVESCSHRYPAEQFMTLFERMRVSRERKMDLTTSDMDRRFEALIDRTSSNFVHNDAQERLLRICARANQILQELLENPPVIEGKIRNIYQWGSYGLVDWSGVDQAGIRMPLANFSFAQNRWINFAIEVASIPDDCPMRLVCLDEPEAGLHRRAERYLARGLANVVQSNNLTALIATHSPEFLGLEGVQLNHVHRDAQGHTVIETLTSDLTSHLHELGLDKSDLLQLCRVVLVVEGQHDLIVLQRLVGEELRVLGVEVLALRGLRNLKNASDAQLLFRFTDADVIYLADNENHERISSIWYRAQAVPHKDALEILSELTRGSSNSEAVFLKEFASLAHGFEAKNRIHLAAVSKGDIIEYLPIEYFIAESSGVQDWAELRRRWTASGAKKSLKAWMSETFGSDFSDAVIGEAASAMDSVPEDFVRLLENVRKISSNRRENEAI
jgi:energy-coupling factor transporter ATP-binding protein EcfA2